MKTTKRHSYGIEVFENGEWFRKPVTFDSTLEALGYIWINWDLWMGTKYSHPVLESFCPGQIVAKVYGGLFPGVDKDPCVRVVVL